jgi:hypothetical protein
LAQVVPKSNLPCYIEKNVVLGLWVYKFQVIPGDAYRTIFPWMAQETQYWSFKYILGTAYSAKTEASEISPIQENPTFSLHISSKFHDQGWWGRTNGSRFDHVADGESLDRLVLGSASRAVGASDRVDVTTALLVTSAVRRKCQNDGIWQMF